MNMYGWIWECMMEVSVQWHCPNAKLCCVSAEPASWSRSVTAAIAALAAAAVFNKLIKVYNTYGEYIIREVCKEYPYCSRLVWLTDSLFAWNCGKVHRECGAVKCRVCVCVGAKYQSFRFRSNRAPSSYSFDCDWMRIVRLRMTNH